MFKAKELREMRPVSKEEMQNIIKETKENFKKMGYGIGIAYIRAVQDLGRRSGWTDFEMNDFYDSI